MIKWNRIGLASFVGTKFDISLNDCVVKLLAFLVGHYAKYFLDFRYLPPPTHSIANTQKHAKAKKDGKKHQPDNNCSRMATTKAIDKYKPIDKRKRNSEKDGDKNATP